MDRHGKELLRCEDSALLSSRYGYWVRTPTLSVVHCFSTALLVPSQGNDREGHLLLEWVTGLCSGLHRTNSLTLSPSCPKSRTY